MRARHERTEQIVTCRECDHEFNLDAQYYYDNLCPTCKEKESEKGTTWPGCVICDHRIDPDDAQTAMSVGRFHSERVTVCSEGCRAHAETEPWHPRGPSKARGENPYGERIKR